MLLQVLELVAVLTGLGQVILTESKHAVVRFPDLGLVQVEARYTPHLPLGIDAEPPYLSFWSALGHELKRIEFEVGKNWHSLLNFTVVHIPQLPDPLVVAVAVEPGGSDHHYESTVVGYVDGELHDLLPKHPQANTQGAFCLGRFGRNLLPAFLSLNFIWEYGVHYQAHRYRCTVYEWDGAEFREKSVLETRRSYESWREAAKELGFHCQRDFKQMLLQVL